MLVVKCAWADDPPSSSKEFRDGGPNTETLLKKHLDGEFKGFRPIFVLIRHQASQSKTHTKGVSSVQRPVGRLFRITFTAYTTEDDEYSGAPVEVKAGHLWVPDKHAKRIANNEEMDAYRLECKKANSADEGPQNPLELFPKEPTDEGFHQVHTLVQKVLLRQKGKAPGTFENPLS